MKTRRNRETPDQSHSGKEKSVEHVVDETDHGSTAVLTSLSVPVPEVDVPGQKKESQMSDVILRFFSPSVERKESVKRTH